MIAGDFAPGFTIDLQQKFIDEHKLPYALLADTDMKLISALGVRMNATAKSPPTKAPSTIV